MKIVIKRQTIKKINSLKDVDKLCTRIHKKILKIGCCRAKRNIRTFEVRKVEFLLLTGFLKELLLKLHNNFFFNIFQDLAKMKKKIKNLAPSTLNKYFEAFRFHF